MSRHVVLGAGPIGRAVTSRLLADGGQVTVATRSGTEVPGAAAVRLAGTDPRLREVLDGAASLVVATNPPYQSWEEEWPPLISNAIDAAAAAGADLALIGNLYGHAPGTSPMTASTPLRPTTRKGAVRARMWEQLTEVHRAGRVRVTEIRASDYYGPESLSTDSAHLGKRFVMPLLAGRTAWVIGDPDAPHSWTAVGDIAATTAAAIASEHGWGRAWVVPTAAPRSLRQVAGDLADVAGLPRATVRRHPRAIVRALGLVDPMMRGLREVLYQHDEPFVSDGSETTELLGVAATPWREVIAATVAAARTATTHPAASPSSVR
ncbi:NAD-dependent epimerase/dehydratase family protein [Pseudactinotalea suaedae]|uniref:NAD-dependent epimerase/dehydratase family protein n=1 Tax=Pseudactinotalea suaedae TaxID=1524924 RepID=UPI0012E24AA5|nr:NAD-dependent epimerase/dehydratase family protein [Pseudactinotalea suaedae]